MYLTQHLKKGRVRSCQMVKISLLTYIVSAGKSSPGCCSNRSFVLHPSPKEAEDALGLAEPGKPAPCLSS